MTRTSSAPALEAGVVRFLFSPRSTAAGPAAGRPGPTSSAAHGAGAEPTFAAEEASVPARLLASSPLTYPPQARQAEIEVDLPLEIVVDPSGHVDSARGLTQAGYGLDEAALQGIRAYRFAPALRDGRPVRVRMIWTVHFRLR